MRFHKENGSHGRFSSRLFQVRQMGFSDLEESPPGTRSPTPDISVLRCALNPPVVGYLFHEALCAVYGQAKGSLVGHMFLSTNTLQSRPT